MKNIKNTLRIYGAGGCGINAVNNISLPNDAAGFPETFFALVDTSKSNISTKHTPKGDVFIIPGIDGSGKNRQFAHQQAVAHVDNMLLACPPKMTNIVIFGLSGGSGSVLGPLLIEELIKRGESVIGICVTSTASAKEAVNAYNTLGTLQNLAMKNLKKPIVCRIYENTATTTRQMVDDRIESDVRALAMLVSGMNHELDKKDLANWLNFDKVTAVSPQLVDLVVHLGETGDNLTSDTLQAIAVANLLPSKDAAELELGQLYSCVGYCSVATQDATTHSIPPMHFIITNSFMGERIAALKATVDQYKRAEEALLATAAPEFDGAEESGFIF